MTSENLFGAIGNEKLSLVREAVDYIASGSGDPEALKARIPREYSAFVISKALEIVQEEQKLQVSSATTYPVSTEQIDEIVESFLAKPDSRFQFTVGQIATLSKVS